MVFFSNTATSNIERVKDFRVGTNHHAACYGVVDETLFQSASENLDIQTVEAKYTNIFHSYQVSDVEKITDQKPAPKLSLLYRLILVEETSFWLERKH